MRSISLINTSALLSCVLLALPSGAQQAADAPAEQQQAAEAPAAPASDTVSAHSRIRIVRLSEVKGEVQLDRNTGKGFETPMTNLPVVEGNRLKTGEGVAEVELEDNSTVHIAPNSLVEFPQLELLPGGMKASTIRVQQGLVYVNMMKNKGNEFAVMFGEETVHLPPDSHIRLQLTDGKANLAVLHGDALVTETAGITSVGKNKTMSFPLADNSEPVIAKNVVEMPTDTWDHDAVQYHQRFANASSFGNAPYAYGINDMNYYGSFINGAGCGGSLWRPYFANAGWDPYGSGAWAYYPSAGYSWVSPYPWGWTAFHYGSWSYCQGVGWGWRGGGDWMGLANYGVGSRGTSLLASSGIGGRPRPPAHPPAGAQASLVPVNSKSIPVSSLSSDHNTFVFRGNSAGFGVPRGSLGKLNSFSGQVANHGVANTSVYTGAERGGSEGAKASSGASSTGYAASSSSHLGASGASSHSSSSSSMQGASGGGGMSHASSGAAGGGGGGGGRR